MAERELTQIDFWFEPMPRGADAGSSGMAFGWLLALTAFFELKRGRTRERSSTSPRQLC
jgi:hypothetical protein